MRRVTAMMSAAAVVLWAVTAFAQAKPDFSGKWTREMPAAAAGGGGGAAGAGGGARGGGGGRGGAGGGGGFNCGMTCDITATATTLKLSRAGQGEGAAPIVWTCTLDGKDCSNEQPGRGGAAPTAVISKATWSGAKLVITTERTGQDGTKVTSTQTLAIEGGKLTVSSTSSMAPEGTAPTVATYTKG